MGLTLGSNGSLRSLYRWKRSYHHMWAEPSCCGSYHPFTAHQDDFEIRVPTVRCVSNGGCVYRLPRTPRTRSNKVELLVHEVRTIEPTAYRLLLTPLKSPGILKISGFDDNGEGIDKKMAVHFYGRFKFFNELAPLLQAAKDAGEEARVVTVLGAGHGGPLDAK